MYSYDPIKIDEAISELVETINDSELRKAILRRLKRNAHLVVGAILTDEAGRICLVQETKGPWRGKWNTPIGHLDQREAIPDGAKREVKEETGYDIELVSLLPPQNAHNNNVLRILYIGKIVGGSPEERNKSDTSAVEWFTIPEIEQMAKEQKLRDAGTLPDIQLYQQGRELPLDAIEEVEYID